MNSAPSALRVLRDCLSARDDNGANSDFEGLPSSEWERIVADLARHRVLPLLHKHLQSLPSPTNVPSSVLEKTREFYLRNVVRNMVLFDELSMILDALANSRVAVILLKGVHPARIIYRDPALRSMSDVDILVKEDDLKAAERAALETGWTACEENEQFAASYRHFTYTSEKTTLNLHWTIDTPGSPFSVDVDGLWERSRTGPQSPTGARVLAPEDLLLHLSLHTAYDHLFSIGLRSFCDISETIRCYGDEIDWAEVERRANQWGIGKCGYLTLSLARKHVGAAVPDAFLERLKPDDFQVEFVAWFEKQVASPREPGALTFGLWHHLPSAWFRRAIVRAFPPPGRLADMYGLDPESRSLYLYYPVRLKDFIWTQAKIARRLLRRDPTVTDEARRTVLRTWLRESAG